MRAALAALGMIWASGCASTPSMPTDPTWRQVTLTTEERHRDPLPDAVRLIDLRETPGNLDHAIALLRWHAERKPGSVELQRLLAEAHSRSAEALDLQKEEDRAPHLYHRTQGREHAEAALKLAPEDGVARYWLAANLLHAADGERSLGRAKAALAELDRADKLAPEVDAGGPARLRGKVLHEMPGLFGGSNARAIASFRRALDLAPDCSTTHLWLAETY
ncbi:MAG: hypothetical protein HY293_13490, partial [Planctomycetes bacterium]|nr:hypothetical protein [Planctomycetota bacterium]